MAARLRAISQKARKVAVGGLTIRQRLVLAGTVLCVLALVTPLYMRGKVRNLTTSYSWTSSNWEILERIEKFDRELEDIDAKLRAYTIKADPQIGLSIRSSEATMSQTLHQLHVATVASSTRTKLVDRIQKDYQAWTKTFVEAALRRKDASALHKLSHQLITEPVRARIQGRLNELADDIRKDTALAHTYVLKASQNTILAVTYGGLVFFAGLATLMVSLWLTLIPGLEALLHYARELKAGNLDHRVKMRGSNEVSQLAHGFNEMAASLKAQNEKLKELNQMKSDFVSIVSHELRTPLTAIKGSIGLILGGITGPLTKEATDMLSITQKNTDRLIRLINEVLDVARIEAGAIKMDFEKHPLAEVISYAVTAIRPYGNEHEVQICWEPPTISPIVVIDRDRIVQVLTNLLSNAIKYTDRGGRVGVNSTLERDRVIVEVVDVGRGIPPEFLDRIFQKFQQAESPTNKGKEGSGLGLTIAKAIIEEHKGSIWVKSEVGVGSTFSFAIPWNGSEVTEPRRTGPRTSSSPRGKRILIIDNEHDFTTVMRKFLEHDGYEVITANTGEGGFALAVNQHPDLILLDVIMPGLNGFDVRKLLSATVSTRSIPIVFATMSPEMQQQAIEKYGATVLLKPIVPEDLARWLETFFGQQQPPKKAA